MRKIAACVLTAAILLTGCSGGGKRSVEYVTRIEVTGEHLGKPIYRDYTSPEKMSAVLGYLRCLKPQSKTVFVPEWLADSTFDIAVYTSHGKTILHRQAGNYYAADAKNWHMVDSEQAEKLFPILESTESDRVLQ